MLAFGEIVELLLAGVFVYLQDVGRIGQPQLSVRPPSLALVALPYVLLAALAWWGRVTSTARWVALAGALLVLALGIALWLVWAETPASRLAAPRLVPGRQLVAIAVVATACSMLVGEVVWQLVEINKRSQIMK